MEGWEGDSFKSLLLSESPYGGPDSQWETEDPEVHWFGVHEYDFYMDSLRKLPPSEATRRIHKQVEIDMKALNDKTMTRDEAQEVVWRKNYLNNVLKDPRYSEYDKQNAAQELTRDADKMEQATFLVALRSESTTQADINRANAQEIADRDLIANADSYTIAMDDHRLSYSTRLKAFRWLRTYDTALSQAQDRMDSRWGKRDDTKLAHERNKLNVATNQHEIMDDQSPVNSHLRSLSPKERKKYMKHQRALERERAEDKAISLDGVESDLQKREAMLQASYAKYTEQRALSDETYHARLKEYETLEAKLRKREEELSSNLANLAKAEEEVYKDSAILAKAKANEKALILCEKELKEANETTDNWMMLYQNADRDKDRLGLKLERAHALLREIKLKGGRMFFWNKEKLIDKIDELIHGNN